MSRAVPSSFSEYLLDGNSVNAGIICDGGIMPLRTSQNPASTWYKKCIRGEDVMFLREAIAARRGSSNSGLSDNGISGSQLLYNVDNLVGWTFQSGAWTDRDPSAGLDAFHLLGSGAGTSANPGAAAVAAHVASALSPISRHGGGNSFDALESAPVENLFKDVGSLNYVVLRSESVSAPSSWVSYGGFSGTPARSVHRVTSRGYSGEPSPRTETADTTDTVYLWRDVAEEEYNYGSDGAYPGGLRLDDVETTTGVGCTFAESSASLSYRQYHRYLAVKPYCVVKVYTQYRSVCRDSGPDAPQQVYDSGVFAYVWCPLPVSGYVDMLAAQTIALGGQAMQGWVSDVFDAAGLEQYAADLTGQYPAANYSRYRIRRCYIQPVYFVWIAHFLYCNLEGVA